MFKCSALCPVSMFSTSLSSKILEQIGIVR